MRRHHRRAREIHGQTTLRGAPVRRHLTLGGPYRRRGPGHDGDVIRAALAAALVAAVALALAARASAPPRLYSPPNSAPAQADGAPPYAVHQPAGRRGRMVDAAAS